MPTRNKPFHRGIGDGLALAVPLWMLIAAVIVTHVHH